MFITGANAIESKQASKQTANHLSAYLSSKWLVYFTVCAVLTMPIPAKT
jgi:hypothetical protein